MVRYLVLGDGGAGITPPVCPMTGRGAIAVCAYGEGDRLIGCVWFRFKDYKIARKAADRWNARGGPFEMKGADDGC